VPGEPFRRRSRPLLALQKHMRLEQLPIILGVLVALIGLTIALDAWQAGGVSPLRERRRRTRAVPQKAGQTLVALGTLCMAAALIGRDTWRWATISVLTGSGLLIIGAIMNRQYLKEVLLFRGATRRGMGEQNSRLNQTPTKTRIR
jgi:xanthine/uracil permease